MGMSRWISKKGLKRKVSTHAVVVSFNRVIELRKTKMIQCLKGKRASIGERKFHKKLNSTEEVSFATLTFAVANF